MQSTPLIAFDQHAATTVAAVLVVGERVPALHTLTSDSPTILRFVERIRFHQPVLPQTLLRPSRTWRSLAVSVCG